MYERDAARDAARDSHSARLSTLIATNARLSLTNKMLVESLKWERSLRKMEQRRQTVVEAISGVIQVCPTAELATRCTSWPQLA